MPSPLPLRLKYACHLMMFALPPVCIPMPFCFVIWKGEHLLYTVYAFTSSAFSAIRYHCAEQCCAIHLQVQICSFFKISSYKSRHFCDIIYYIGNWGKTLWDRFGTGTALPLPACCDNYAYPTYPDSNGDNHSPCLAPSPNCRAFLPLPSLPPASSLLPAFPSPLPLYYFCHTSL